MFCTLLLTINLIRQCNNNNKVQSIGFTRCTWCSSRQVTSASVVHCIPLARDTITSPCHVAETCEQRGVSLTESSHCHWAHNCRHWLTACSLLQQPAWIFNSQTDRQIRLSDFNNIDKIITISDILLSPLCQGPLVGQWRQLQKHFCTQCCVNLVPT